MQNEALNQYLEEYSGFEQENEKECQYEIETDMEIFNEHQTKDEYYTHKKK